MKPNPTQDRHTLDGALSGTTNSSAVASIYSCAEFEMNLLQWTCKNPLTNGNKAGLLIRHEPRKG